VEKAILIFNLQVWLINPMADKKNIVIKVKYPNSQSISENAEAVAKTVTEWNIKRIAFALAGILLGGSALLYFLKSEPQTTEVSEPTAAIMQDNVAKPLANEPINASNGVVRAQLSYKIVNNEPVNEISIPVKLSKKHSTWIYYFVELNSMKGKTVFHEWLLNGDLITRKKVNISDEKWRTSSKQVFSYTSENKWLVRLVDETGSVLNEKRFDVIYE
jgi:Protein of unknown function (DUF2914)